MFERIFISNSTLLSMPPRRSRRDLSRGEDNLKFWKLYKHPSFLVCLQQKCSAVNKENDE